MARVLAISSYVARGHIGLGAIVPALNALGHEVVALPTIVLSNHPGHAHVACHAVPAERLREMAGVYEVSGWLGEFDAVLTGYLPSVAHVRAAAGIVCNVRSANESAFYLCDPVLGDDPGGLYIDEAAAAAIRAELIPLANLVTPNRFELAWLAGRTVDTARDAAEAARKLGEVPALVTSVPASHAHVQNLLVHEDGVFVCTVPRLPHVPHGTGDFMAALYLGWTLDGTGPADSLARAVAGTRIAAESSAAADELQLAAKGPLWSNPAPEPVEVLGN
jgi:pyridoxine kinase